MMKGTEALDILRAQGYAAGTPEHRPSQGLDSRQR